MRLPALLLRSCTLLAALIVWAPAASHAAIVEYVLTGSITSVPDEISSISVDDTFEARLLVDLDTPPTGLRFNEAVVSYTIRIGSWTSFGGPTDLVLYDDICAPFLSTCPQDWMIIVDSPVGVPLLDGYPQDGSGFALRSDNVSLITDPTSVPDLVMLYDAFFADPGDEVSVSSMTINLEDPFSVPGLYVGGVVESVVRSAPGECADLVDNDGDTLVDHPDDPDCWGSLDLTESPDCSDGIDNDGDLLVDLADPGCVDGSDQTETAAALLCDNAIDDDLDGLVDSADPGCIDPTDSSESSATIACDDDLDNDGDGLVDFDDPGCSGAADLSEKGVLVCDDGLDNDGDGLFDDADPGCENYLDPTEEFVCEDSLDNDGDGFVDLADPGCADLEDSSEQSSALICDDGVDNDEDGLVDMADPECLYPAGNTETKQPGARPSCGLLSVEALPLLGLLALRRRRRA